jgi:hypothetical protein
LRSEWPIYLIVNAAYGEGIVLAFYSPALSYAVFFNVLVGAGFNVCREILRAGLPAEPNDGGAIP